MNENVLRILVTAQDQASSVFLKIKNAGDAFSQSVRDWESDNNSFRRALIRVKEQSSEFSGEIDRANAALKRFGVGGAVLTILPQLIVMVTQLGAQFIALASSALFAAGALTGGLAAGFAQAVPAIGLLMGALSSVKTVMDAVKESNKAGEKATKSAADASDRQRSIQDALRDAHERVAEAQRKLTLARREARRELKDMILEQERAVISSKQADLSLEQSKQALRKSQVSGDLTGMAEGELDVASDKIDRVSSKRDVRRGGADLNRALAAGTEGSEGVIAARNALRDAIQALDKAQRDAAKSANDLNGELSKAESAINKLNPAQKRLFNSIIDIQKTVKESISSSIDYIIDGFTFAVDRANKVLQSLDVQKALGKIGMSLRDGIKEISSAVTSAEGQKIFVGLSEAAAKNIPSVSKALANLTMAFGRFAMAGRPFVEWMIKGFEKWTEGVEKGSKNTGKLTKFFVDGQKHLSAWVELTAAILDFFFALGGSAADTGLKTTRDMAKSLRSTADQIRSAEKETKKFWDTVYSLNKPMAEFFKSIGKMFIDVFKGGGAESFKSFSRLMSEVLVPALTAVMKVTAVLTDVLVTFLTLPFVKDVLKWSLIIAGVVVALFKFAAILEFLGIVVLIVAKAFRLLATAMLRNPIIAVLTAIGVAIYLLDKKFHFIRPTLNAVGRAFERFGKAIWEALGPVFKWIGEKFKDLGTVLSDPEVKKALQVLGKLFSDFFGIIIDGLVEIAKFVGNTFKKIAEIIGDGPTADALKFLGKLVAKTFGRILDLSQDLNAGLRKIVRRIGNLLTDGAIADGIAWLVRAFRRAYNRISDVLGDMVDRVRRGGRRIRDSFASVFDFIKDNVSDSFRWILNRLDSFWDKFIAAIDSSKDKVKDAFKSVARGIKNIFVEAFKGIYDAVRDVINGIANGVSKITNLPGISSVVGKVPKNPMPPYDKAFATGGVIKAKPGGIVAKMGEAGFDEVVLTTDPKHKNNTKRLLSMFLSKTNLMPDYEFAKGGYVQGAKAPGNSAALALAEMMFNKGFSVTSARDKQHSPTSYHYANGGSALDFGDSVNDLSSVWRVLYPMRSAFAELFGPKGLFKGSKQFSSPGLQKSHNNHVHVATPNSSIKALKESLSGALKGVKNAIGDSPLGDIPKWIKGALKNFGSWVTGYIGKNPKNNNKLGPFKGLLGDVWGAYRKKIKESVEEANSNSDDSGSGSPSGSVKSWLAKALKITKNYSSSNLKSLYGRAMQESGGNPKAINKWDINAKMGTPSKGLLQVIDPTFRAYKLPKYNNIWDPVHNAVAAIRYMLARYGKIVGPSDSGYAVGGELLGEEGAELNVKAHAGEMIINRKQQMALGGPAKLRSLFGFSPRTGKFSSGGEVGLDRSTYKSTNKAISGFDDPVKDFYSDLLSMSKKLIDYTKGNKGTKKLLAVVRQITSDDGPIASMLESLSTMRDRFASFIKSKKFKVDTSLLSDKEQNELDKLDKSIEREGDKKRPNRKRLNTLKRRRSQLLSQAYVVDDLSDTDQSKMELVELEAESKILAGAQFDIKSDIGGVEKKLRAEKKKGKRGSKKKIKQYEAMLDALNNRLSEVDNAAAEALEARLEKQKEIIENSLNDVNKDAEKRNDSTDIKKRIASALGNISQLPSLIDEQMSTVNSQIGGLNNVLAEARKFGDKDLVDSITKQINDLNTSLTEMAVERINAAINVVNTTASNSLSLIDLKSRMASISKLGQADYTTLGSLIGERGDALKTQRSGLEGLLNSAILQGNKGLIDSLTQSIYDLDASIQENSLAVEQNTVLALQQKIDATNKGSGFLVGVADASLSIIRSVGAMMGVEDTASLISISKSKGSTLTEQGKDLRGYLDEFLGGSLSEDFLSVSGADLIGSIDKIIASTDLSGMIQEEVDQFYALIDAILQNEQSVQDNTSALAELTGEMTTQSFTTTAWEKFRQAIFDGSGNLLSKYDIPHMAEGGFIKKEGLFYLHAGEKVTPSEMVGSDGSTNIEVNMHSVTPETDAELVAKKISWELSKKGRF